MCPHCGDGPLYSGILDVKQACDVCGFDLRAADAGDGAQVFVIFILGGLNTLLGIFLYNLDLPKWAMMLVLITFIIGGTIWMLRIFKATLIALQFHHDAGEGTLGEDCDDS